MKNSQLSLICRVLLCAPLSLCTFAANAEVIDSTWTGGDSNWNTSGNWSPVGVPNNAADTFSVSIDDGSSTVGLNTTSTVNALILGTGNTLNINNNRSLTLTTLSPSVALNNLGSINLNATDTATQLGFSGDALITGPGVINLSNNSNNQITAGGLLTNSSGHTIQGAGSLLNNAGGMLNQGTIIANQPTALTIDPDTGFTNVGTLQATGTGGLTLKDGVFTNTGQNISIGDGSKLTLSGNAELIGGSLTGTGSGLLTFTGTKPVMDNVTLNANSLQGSNMDVDVRNDLINNGVYSIDSNSSTSFLTFISDSPSLLGTGVLNLNNSLNNRIIAPGKILTHGADHTIEGSGVIIGGFGGMINKGTIIANQDSPMVLFGNELGIVNEGNIETSGTGGLHLGEGQFINTGRTIHVHTGSYLLISGDLEIIGGSIETAGTGFARLSYENTVLEDLTFSGTLKVLNAIDMQVRNTLTNNGTINLLSNGLSTSIEMTGTNPTLTGTGEIVMTNDINNRIFITGGTFTQTANHTIRGAGNLLSDQGGMINQGTIIADQNTALTIDPDASGFVNHGKLSATGSGGIVFGAGDITNSATGVITGTTTYDVSLANFTNAGTISPGSSPGTLTIDGDITFEDTANLFIEIAGTMAGSEYDVLNVTGSGQVALDGDLEIELLDYTPLFSDQFTIVMSTGNISGSFDNVIDGSVFFDGGSFAVAINPNSVVLSNYSAVPEPHQWALLVSLAALGVALRKRQRHAR